MSDQLPSDTRFKPPAILARTFDLGTAVPEIDNPVKEMRTGRLIIIAFFVVFLGWAAIVRVDSAVYASGMIAVSGNRQSVQHQTGGVVAKLDVKEGDQVQKGQVLVELAGDRSEADANAYMANYISMKVQEARLLAEATGQSSFAEPVEFRTFTGENRALVDEAMKLQRQSMSARNQFVAAQISVLRQQQAQTRDSINGSQEQLDAKIKRKNLTEDELTGILPLEAKGYAPKTYVRQLQQNIAGLEGDVGSLKSDIAKASSAIGESQSRELTTRRQATQDVMDELRQTQQKLTELTPQLTAAQSEYDRTEIRATATGKVVGLSVFNAGGVISPGQKILDIVPDNAPLIIESNVAAKDGDDIRAGQEAQIRFSALQERDLPAMSGKVLSVSADSFQDQKNGTFYYKAEIEVSPENIAKITKIRGNSSWLKPGLPVEVIVPLRKRSMLDYLMEPLNQTLWKSFREH